ncbi:MAG: DUF1566 domain-containing protein [Spirochaetales bacterium]|jgi:hypothetical protein|nr:DUF1566 domain-containing protein [Spirochaetales bacterium]
MKRSKRYSVIYTVIITVLAFILGCQDAQQEGELNVPPQIYIKAPGIVYDKPIPANRANLKVETLPIKMKADHLCLPEKSNADEIVWKSSVDGIIGKGEEVEAVLSIGIHEITATYTDEIVTIVGTTTVEVKQTPIDLFKEKPVKKVPRIRRMKDQDGDVLIIDYDNDVITDQSTGLMWMRFPASYKYTHHEAIQYARSLKLAGFNDWRLPSLAELSDISNIVYDGRSAIINREFVCREGKFWTSDKHPSKPDCAYVIKYTCYPQYNHAYYAEKSFVHVSVPLSIRLVRNVK